MRFLVTLVSAAAMFIAAAAGLGQEEPRRSPRLPRGFDRQAPEEQPVRRTAGRLIATEVIIADVSGDPEPDMTSEKLAELSKAGRVASLTRLKLSALENQPAMLQFGERVPVVTGRATFGGRGSQEIVSQESVGTLIQVTSRVEGDESILMELQAEISRLVPTPMRADAENADAPAGPPRTVTITTKSTLRIAPGKTVVAGSRTTETEHGPLQTWILVSASADGARPAPVDETSVSELKVFTLVNAQADSLAELLQNVFRSDGVRIAVDARTNSLIIHANAASHDVIQALIQRLDEPHDSPAAR